MNNAKIKLWRAVSYEEGAEVMHNKKLKPGVYYDSLETKQEPEVEEVTFDKKLKPGVYYDSPKAKQELEVEEVTSDKKLKPGVYYELPEPKQELEVVGVTSDKEPQPGVYYEPLESKQETEGDNRCILVNLQEESIIPAKKAIESQNTSVNQVVVGTEMISRLNFDLQLLRICIEVFDTANGEIYEYFYFIKIRVRSLNGQLKEFADKVSSSKVKTFDWITKATYSLATIPSRKDEKDEFHVKVQECIETEGVPKEIIYPTAGWRNVLGYGWRYVFKSGMVGEDNTLIHTAASKYNLDVKQMYVGKKETFDMILEMMQVCNNLSSSVELTLFTHMGVLRTLFEQAGYPVNFVFGIVGVTNSRKTSMVTALAKIFDRNEKLTADAEFATATECGIEKVLGTYKDGVVIVDDFKPGVDMIQQKVMNKKLDLLVRLFGDRVPKMRMNDYQAEGDKKYFPINGVCVLTMELITGVESTLSRMFITEIGAKDVNNEKLAYFQKERWILPTHIYDFLAWITKNYDNVVKKIVEYIPKLREQKVFAFPRYIDMYATFVVIAEIISDYALARGFKTQQEAVNFCNVVERIIATELENMGSRIRRRDKAILVLSAISESLSLNKLSPLWLTPDTASLRKDSYENEKYFFIQTKKIRQVANEYCRAYGESCEIVNDDEIIGLLQRLEVLDVQEKDGKRISSRKLPIQRGNTLRYLYIKKAKMRDICEE